MPTNVCTDILYEGEQDWEKWGCIENTQGCPPGNIYQCNPGIPNFGQCLCYPESSHPSIDNCGRCNLPQNQNIDDIGCGCCRGSCSACGSPEICTDVDCYLSGGNPYECCDIAGADCGSLYGDDIDGCTDEQATNYDPVATVNDGTCEYDGILGCTDTYASNFLDQPGICNTPDPDGCGGVCYNNSDDDICPSIDDGSCQYTGYVEPSVDRLWKFMISNQIIEGNIYETIFNSIGDISVGDSSNLYYGELYDMENNLLNNEDIILVAIVNNEIRGTSTIKNTPNKSYFYIEVKWNYNTEFGDVIHFYSIIDNNYYSIDEIYKFGSSGSIEIDYTSDFGLFNNN